MSVWNDKIMPNTDLYREKKGDRCKTHCKERIKNKNQGIKKNSSCFLGLPGEKRPVLSQQFTPHTAWFQSRKITPGFSWHNAWRSQAWAKALVLHYAEHQTAMSTQCKPHTHMVFTRWDNDRTDLSLFQSWRENSKIDFSFIPNNPSPGLVKKPNHLLKSNVVWPTQVLLDTKEKVGRRVNEQLLSCWKRHYCELS